MPAILCHAVCCTAARKRSQFMCLDHWRRLPHALREQINTTWRAWQARENDGSALWLAYVEACDEARDEATRWTAEGEGRLAQFEPDAPRIRMLHAMREAR